MRTVRQKGFKRRFDGDDRRGGRQRSGRCGFLECLRRYYYLGVHIADVTNYVQENSALDREAKKRGTSVYLADRVIPMLPHTLSNGILFSQRREDRLALSCLMKINEKEIVDHEIVESVIRVDRRMTYTAVKRILEDGDEEQCRLYRDFVPCFSRCRHSLLFLGKAA